MYRVWKSLIVFFPQWSEMRLCKVSVVLFTRIIRNYTKLADSAFLYYFVVNIKINSAKTLPPMGLNYRSCLLQL